MIVVSVAALVALLAVIVLQSRSQASERDAWATERSELLTRIQRPESVPVLPVPDWIPLEDSELDPDGLVGSITIDDDYGQEEF